MKVAVIGLGQFGRALVTELARSGAEVFAVDRNLEAVDDVKDEAAVAVRLDGADEKDLRAQGVHKVDVLVAAMGESFEATALTVLTAKRLEVPKVIARADNSDHARILTAIGADVVVVPLRDAAADLAQRILTPGAKNSFELAEGVSVVEVEAPKRFHHVKVKDLDLAKRHRVNLVAIRHRGAAGGPEVVNPVPLPDEKVLPGDVLVLVGFDADAEAFARNAG